MFSVESASRLSGLTELEAFTLRSHIQALKEQVVVLQTQVRITDNVSTMVHEENSQLRSEISSLRAELLRRDAEAAAAAVAPAVPAVAAEEEDEGHSLPNNSDVDVLLAYVRHASYIYADRSDVPARHACMDALTNGDRLYVCRATTAAAAAPAAIHPSRLLRSELYYVTTADNSFFAFFDRRNNRVYRSFASLKAALDATYGDPYVLAVRNAGAEDATYTVVA
jgi:hypothetical protein